MMFLFVNSVVIAKRSCTYDGLHPSHSLMFWLSSVYLLAGSYG